MLPVEVHGLAVDVEPFDVVVDHILEAVRAVGGAAVHCATAKHASHGARATDLASPCAMVFWHTTVSKLLLGECYDMPAASSAVRAITLPVPQLGIYCRYLTSKFGMEHPRRNTSG